MTVIAVPLVSPSITIILFQGIWIFEFTADSSILVTVLVLIIILILVTIIILGKKSF